MPFVNQRPIQFQSFGTMRHPTKIPPTDRHSMRASELTSACFTPRPAACMARLIRVSPTAPPGFAWGRSSPLLSSPRPFPLKMPLGGLELVSLAKLTSRNPTQPMWFTGVLARLAADPFSTGDRGRERRKAMNNSNMLNFLRGQQSRENVRALQDRCHHLNFAKDPFGPPSSHY
uniref:Uncharacterized protein n=1 Tax=Bionectria ochroleuca TaxID=29856 RepID=A0A8H7N4R9_BIOOC